MSGDGSRSRGIRIGAAGCGQCALGQRNADGRLPLALTRAGRTSGRVPTSSTLPLQAQASAPGIARLERRGPFRCPEAPPPTSRFCPAAPGPPGAQSTDARQPEGGRRRPCAAPRPRRAGGRNWGPEAASSVPPRPPFIKSAACPALPRASGLRFTVRVERAFRVWTCIDQPAQADDPETR